MATILVIDDSKFTLALIDQMLSAAGHTVIATTDARRGVDMLKSVPFQVLITDIYMPDHDGIEVIAAARQTRPELPVIAISAKPAEINLFSMAEALGASLTLKKPFTAEQLNRSVAQVMDNPELGKRVKTTTY